MENNRLKNGILIVQYAIENGVSVRKSSIIHGFSATYVKNIKMDINKAEKRGVVDDNPLMVKFKDLYQQYIKNIHFSDNESKLKTEINMGSNPNKMNLDFMGESKHIKTIEDLIDHCDIDQKLWEIKKSNVTKWDVTSTVSGEPQVSQNFKVSLSLEKKIEENRAEIAAEIFRKKIESYKPPEFNFNDINFIDKNINLENNLFEASIFDLHLGKLAWAGETGENYDTKIASDRFIFSIKELILRAKKIGFTRILFPLGSDFFNSDTLHNTTTKGTPQDEDLRWQKTFDLGLDLALHGINLLKQTGKPVDVLIIPGNHDMQRSYYLGAALERFFRSDTQVNINNGASPRKYYNFGKVLLGFTHGSEEKESSLPMLMATEQAGKCYWSDVEFREWHLGHIHRKRSVNYTILEKNKVMSEDLGITVRYLSSLTGTEEWHHRKGFVSQIKAAEGFIWNDKNGLIANLNVNITL